MDEERGGNRARAPAGTQRGWEGRCPGPLTRPGGEEDEAKVTEDAQPAQHITHHHNTPPPSLRPRPAFVHASLARTHTTAFSLARTPTQARPRGAQMHPAPRMLFAISRAS